MYTPAKERAKVIKQALSKMGFEKVSVRSGSGTASSWCECSVDIEKPSDCSCDENRMCEICRKTTSEAREMIELESNKALEAKGMKHSMYYSDDPYAEPRNEFLVSIRLV